MPEMPSKHAPELPASAASAIRRLVVPLTGPPYDGEPDRPSEDGNEATPTGSDAMPPGRDGGSPPPPRPGPGEGRWPSQFAQALAETLAGSRPSRQLTPWTTEAARRQIRQLGPLLATRERPLVRRVMTSAPAGGVLELTAVVGFGPRVRILALRLERDQTGRGWCCTAVESA
jgi:Family of unknown function (DUF6459)